MQPPGRPHLLRGRVISGIDLGTHQITVAVGHLSDARQLEVLALTSGPTQGLAHGVIVDLADCVDAVARVVRQAENQIGVRVTTAAATIHGQSVQRRNAIASVALSDSHDEISRWDVERVLAACRTAASTYDHQHLHEWVQRFTVDEQDGVRDPVGLFGGRLAVAMHIVTAPTSVLQSWRKVFNHAGVEANALVLPAVATSGSVLSELDRELGAIVVDIGGAHTDIVCCVDGAVRETLTVPQGGDGLTGQIAERFELPTAAAEQAKLRLNSIETEMSGADEPIRVRVGQGYRAIRRVEVAKVLAEGTKELFTQVRQQLETSRYFREASAGMVVTGGTALMQGVLELAETLCNLPVRLGALQGDIVCHPRIGTVPPTASTAVGLLAYQVAMRRSARSFATGAPRHPIGRLVQQAKSLLEDYF